MREDAHLEALLLKGLASGEDIPLTRKFWRELKEDADAMVGETKPSRGADPQTESLAARLINSQFRCEANVAEDRSEVLRTPGYYAIFVHNPDELPDPFGRTLRVRGTDLIYIGVAKKTDLRDRLLKQDLRHERPSTFFRSLGAILGYRPRQGSLSGKKAGNYRFSIEETNKVIAWINGNLRIHWIPDGSVSLVEEKGAILERVPLLNIAHNPMRIGRLIELREECREIARQAPLALES